MKPEQPEKAFEPIEDTPSPIVRFPEKPMHPANASLPIDVRALPQLDLFPKIVKSPVKPLQPENAESPIEVTLFGIVRFPVKPLQPRKAP